MADEEVPAPARPPIQGSASERPAQLRQRLHGFQIFFIVLTSVVGTGVFSNNGQALEVAGPMGLLLCVVLMGIFAIFIGETLSELVQLFPAPNAIFCYVSAFVDEDLAWVIGVSYWYAFATIFATQMLGAAKLLSYWSPAPVWPPLIFYGLMPWLLFALNLCGVDAFGWVETVGGALKVILVFGVSCILYNIARKKDAGGPTGPINDGFKNNASFATTPFKAFCYAFPLAAYGFLGIETTVMAAYEARTAKSIARPSQWVHWVVFVLYFMCTIGLALNVPWDHDHLPSMLARLTKQTTPPFSTSATVIAVYSDNPGLAAFLNGCLIFSVVSAANTALYVASRTLYGLTYNLGDGLLARRFKGASTIWDATGVPAAALFLTVLSFYWLPWLMLIGNFAIDDLIKIVSLSSSVACLIVWAALCLAFHRFEKWTRLCAPALVAQHPDLARFVRGSALYRKRVFNVLSWGQPWVARLGLVGCIVVWVLASATWWDTPVSVQKVAAAYGTHIVLFLFWVGLKLSQGKFRPGTWWVPMTTGSNPKDLISRLRRLERLSEKGEDRGRNRYGASADRPRASSFAWEVPVTEASGTPPHLKGLASPGNVTVDSRGG